MTRHRSGQRPQVRPDNGQRHPGGRPDAQRFSREDSFQRVLNKPTQTIVISSPYTARLCEVTKQFDAAVRRVSEEYARGKLDSYRYQKACTQFDSLIAEFSSKFNQIRNNVRNKSPKAFQNGKPNQPQQVGKNAGGSKPAAATPGKPTGAPAASKTVPVAADGKKPSEATVATTGSATPATPATGKDSPSLGAVLDNLTSLTRDPAATPAPASDTPTSIKGKIRETRAKAARAGSAAAS